MNPLATPSPIQNQCRTIEWAIENDPAYKQYSDAHDVWAAKADEAFPNRHLLVRGLDHAYAWYQEWLAANPEPTFSGPVYE